MERLPRLCIILWHNAIYTGKLPNLMVKVDSIDDYNKSMPFLLSRLHITILQTLTAANMICDGLNDLHRNL